MSTQKNEVMIVVCAGQLSMAIARRVGFGMKNYGSLKLQE